MARTDELAQLYRNVTAWEKQLDGFRSEAIAAEALAQRKWDQVAFMEARIATDMDLIAELEHGRG